MATLYVVSTPIGNVDDLSPRALRVLGEVDRVLAEDTRHTGLLLHRLGVKRPLVSLHEHNEASRTEELLGWLEAGESLALVSDAGTPLVSDPGARVVAAVAEAGHEVVPVPGPSAALAALVVSGLPAERFAFLGFAPRKGPDRASTLRRVGAAEETTILFESPERLAALLGDLAEACGEGRRAAVTRELTKLHETVRRGTLGELARYYGEERPRGEVTVVVAPADAGGGAPDEARERARELAGTLLDAGLSPSRAARELARYGELSRNDAYELVQELSETMTTTKEKDEA